MRNITPIFYWITTSLITLETLVGGFANVTHGRTALVTGPLATDVLAGLGYPAYLLWIIGIWKILWSDRSGSSRLPAAQGVGVCRHRF